VGEALIGCVSLTGTYHHVAPTPLSVQHGQTYRKKDLPDPLDLLCQGND
jgi:hypothetical protein